MKKAFLFFIAAMMVFSTVSSAGSLPVTLYLDTAPNANGSSSWPGFRDASYAEIFADTFVNQEHSFNTANIGTFNYEVQDYFVYSFGDLGKRLHAFYYIPGETTASLGDRFQVSIQYQYDGVWYNPYEAYGWGEWVTPSGWTNYDGNGDGTIDGVMGSMGNALWGAYGFTADTPEARAALASDVATSELYLGNTRFLARLDNNIFEVQAVHTPVPVPCSVLLLGSGLLGLAGFRKKLNK